MLKHVFWNMKNYFCTRKMPKASSQSWRSSLVKTIVAEKQSVFKQKPGCITITVIGNVPVSKLMQLNCRNWCPATTLGMCTLGTLGTLWYTGTLGTLGVVWSGATPSGNRFKILQFIDEVMLLLTINLSILTDIVNLSWIVLVGLRCHVVQVYSMLVILIIVELANGQVKCSVLWRSALPFLCWCGMCCYSAKRVNFRT